MFSKILVTPEQKEQDARHKFASALYADITPERPSFPKRIAFEKEPTPELLSFSPSTDHHSYSQTNTVPPTSLRSPNSCCGLAHPPSESCNATFSQTSKRTFIKVKISGLQVCFAARL